jgi:quinol monooxygenase YgiN
MGNKLTVVATVVAKQECVEAVKAELLKLVAPTRLEAGCLEYTLHQDIDDPCLFIFYETWENEAALADHMNSPHFRAYINAVEGMIAEKAVRRMSEIP